MDYAAAFKGLFTLIGVVFGFLFGGWTVTLYALLAFVCVDYLTGVIAAASEGKLDPRTGYVGVAKKVFIFLGVALAHLADVMLNVHVIQEGTIFFYISTEFISINKNFGRLGVPVPDFLAKAIANFPTKASPLSPEQQVTTTGGGNSGK